MLGTSLGSNFYSLESTFLAYFYFYFLCLEMKGLVIWVLVLFCHGASGVGADEVSVKEGDSVTLNTGVKTDQEEIIWYFNDSRIAQITGDQSKICTDVKCKERFGDRLKLDHQTGSLTISNTRKTDSGKYTLQLLTGSGRTKTFHVSVQGVSAAEQEKEKIIAQKEGESSDHGISAAEQDEWKIMALKVGESSESSDHDSGPSSAAVAGICVAVVVLLVAAASAAVIYYRKRQGREDSRSQHSYNENVSPNPTDPLMTMTTTGTSPNLTEAAKETSS